MYIDIDLQLKAPTNTICMAREKNIVNLSIFFFVSMLYMLLQHTTPTLQGEICKTYVIVVGTYTTKMLNLVRMKQCKRGSARWCMLLIYRDRKHPWTILAQSSKLDSS